MEIFPRILKQIPRVNNILIRTIMATSVRAEKALEDMKNNPYFEKYSKKIAALQQTSPEEFLSRVEAHEKKKKPLVSAAKEKQFSSLLQPKTGLSVPADVQDEPLDKIMKIDLIKDKTTDEIEQIWANYHLQKDVIAAIIPAADFEAMKMQLQKFPTFLFPLPRSQGYEFIMSQSQRNVVHFTPLICYQVHKENAPECLKLTHYTEFKDSKGIVLMRGEFDKNAIDGIEAQCLANQLQLYYSGKDKRKSELVEQFTLKPDEFKHTDLIKQIENITLQ